MKYTVIDFETANSKRDSACALGIVVVEDGKIIEECVHLIRPYDMLFLGMNIAIHGIKPADVIDQPTFDVLYKNVFKKYIENQVVVAHNASFDMSVLRACLTYYDIPFPECRYICTVKVAQKHWPTLKKHSLDYVSAYLNFKFKHHDALDDARACAHLLNSVMLELKVETPIEVLHILNIKTGMIYKNGYKACSIKKDERKKR